MAATSIHIRECIIDHSIKHNMRQIVPDYVRTDLSYDNENFIVVANLNERLEEIKIFYKEKTKQKLHKKANPIREGVIVIDENTTMGDLRLFGESCKAKWGITPLQYFIHRDEGHYDENKQWKPNYHAHIVFDWQNKTTGKTCKLNQNDMRDMQTLLAECLGMERGIQSDKRHLDHIQYKISIEEEKMAELALKQAEMNEKLKHSTLALEMGIKASKKSEEFIEVQMKVINENKVHIEEQEKYNEQQKKELVNLDQKIKKDKKAIQDLQSSIEDLTEKERALKMNVGYLSQELEEIEEQKYKDERRKNPSFVDELLDLIEEIPIFGSLFAKNRGDVSPMSAIKLALGKKVYIDGKKTFLDENGNKQIEKIERTNIYIQPKKKKGLGF